MAVAFNPTLDYVGVQTEDAVYIVAEELLKTVVEKCHLKLAGASPEDAVIARLNGAYLARVTFQHPFLDREILGVTADYVTVDQGTGAVHTAPAHGPDDFETGKPVARPLAGTVAAQGKLRNGLPEYDGMFVFKANSVIKDLLRERGALLAAEDIHH